MVLFTQGYFYREEHLCFSLDKDKDKQHGHYETGVGKINVSKWQ